MKNNRKKFSNNELITRKYPATFRAVDDEKIGSIIEGTPIVFNQDTLMEDWAGKYYERIDSHALDEADLTDIRLFVNHDVNKIALARTQNGKGTMSFNIDNEGFHFRAELDTENNAEARSLYSAIKRGDMDGMSFMFRISGREWENEDAEIPTLIIKKISIVHEVSVVNFPAYPQTNVEARNSKYSPLAELRGNMEEKTKLEIAKLKNANLLKMQNI